MKKIIFYIAALTMAVGCTETMIDEPSISTPTSSEETVFATLNLNFEGATSDTRLSVTPGAESTDSWKVDWEDGDKIIVYSIAQQSYKNLTYVADGNSGGTFSGDVYPGENRVYYLCGDSYINVIGTDMFSTDEPLVILYSYATSLTNGIRPTMINSEVITIEATDDDGDGVVTDTFDVTMQQVGAMIDFKMTFTGIDDDLDLELCYVEVGGIGGVDEEEYIELPGFVYTYPTKSVDASDFICHTDYDSAAGGEMSVAIENDKEYSMQFSVMPFTFEAGKKLQVTLYFNDGAIVKSFDFTNNSGANFEFPRATHSYLEKTYDLSDIIDSMFAGTWAADAVAFADTTSAGTESDPIEIASEAELAYLAKIATGLFSTKIVEDGYYKLTKDLDLSGNEWYPISAEIINFDGGDYTISNLTINNSEAEYQGLFGNMSGHISNLKMKDPIVSGYMYIGAICGYLSSGSLSNCSVTDCTMTGFGNHIGGVIGYSTGPISDCNINGGSVTGSTFVGGVAGYSKYTDITRCYNESSAIYGYMWVGGVVGYTLGSSLSGRCNISECYNTGVVTGSETYYTGTSSITISSYGIGGVVGRPVYTTTTRCYNTGDINAKYMYGGVIGQMSTSGICVACYNTGTISETTYANTTAGPANGGIIGIANSTSGVVSACYDASQAQYMIGYISNGVYFTSCYCFSPTVLANPDYGYGAQFETGYSTNCAQLSDVAALNAKVDEMNAAANTALETTDVVYFTADATGTYLPSVMGEQITFETSSSSDSSSDSIEDFSDNGGLSE